jgi:salicylate hydroxylase
LSNFIIDQPFDSTNILESVSSNFNTMASDPSVLALQICIIGAGMGGLTCALSLAKQGFSNITVYESASNLGFVGAGIQLAPNMARVLDRLGVWANIEKEAVVLRSTSIRQGSTGGELANVKLDYVKETYGYAHSVGHRANLAGSIYEGCQREKNIKFMFATEVSDVDTTSTKPSFNALKRGESEPQKISCDVLLAADGVKSIARVAMLHALGVSATVQDTGQAAYRIMLTREQMASDPELVELIDAQQVVRWIGAKRHIIAYPVQSNQIYNLSTTQPDKNFAEAPSATYTTKASKPAMLEVFADFCPIVQKMLNLVPEGEVCEWKLRIHEPLPTWVHNSTALVGDACHPTLPHMAQGAAQAIEDAAVLGVVLSRLPDTSSESINKGLRVYETVRKERAETLVELAAASARGLHLGDDNEAAKKKRDAEFAALKEGKGPVPDKWADAEVQKMVYSFDCDREAEREMERVFGKAKI